MTNALHEVTGDVAEGGGERGGCGFGSGDIATTISNWEEKGGCTRRDLDETCDGSRGPDTSKIMPVQRWRTGMEREEER
ncbi:peptidoglycan bridge formation glycyltransferase FemA/FemB family [Sesbania bispinosa]|nr:peptidoglycan bridge formation glycyltransferase FemA/FemB family [Sesbania bispinosa]